MRPPAAFLLYILMCLLWTACNGDDIDCCFPEQTIDCDAFNISDSTTCNRVSNLDSASYVGIYLGTWRLAASQSSGFGTGNTSCVNYSISDSPVKFMLNEDYTWRYVSLDPAVDTTLNWSAVSGFAGWISMSSDQAYPIPQPQNLCGEYLVRDDRPVDGSLFIYRRG